MENYEFQRRTRVEEVAAERSHTTGQGGFSQWFIRDHQEHFERYLQHVEKRLTRAHERGETPGRRPRYPFEELDRTMSALQESVHRAMRLDDKEANSFWRKLKSFLSGKLAAFKREARRIKQQANQQLDHVFDVYRAEIVPHRNVPDKLNDDAMAWQERQDRVIKLRQQATSLERVPGWTGPASDEYASAVRLQIEALDDLANVMRGAADSCLKGATGNAGRLTNTRIVVALTRANIWAARGGGGKYYQRTAAAIRGMEVMVREVDEILHGTGAKSFARDLAAENKNSSTQGVVLADWWPSGTQRSFSSRNYVSRA